MNVFVLWPSVMKLKRGEKEWFSVRTSESSISEFRVILDIS
jgi:hypothetical protein